MVWCIAASYGDRAQDITRIAEQRKLGRRLVRGHPVLEAEVVYAVHHEYCETPEDFIARRSRLAFLDHRACGEALPRVSCLHTFCCLTFQHDILLGLFCTLRDAAHSVRIAQTVHAMLSVYLTLLPQTFGS